MAWAMSRETQLRPEVVTIVFPTAGVQRELPRWLGLFEGGSVTQARHVWGVSLVIRSFLMVVDLKGSDGV